MPTLYTSAPCLQFPKKVLVTGGSGFVGRNLVSALVNNGTLNRLIFRNSC